MSAPISWSLHWRQEGNKLYKSVLSSNLAPVVAQGRLQDALNKYYRAIETAFGCVEYASALKNYGVASYKLASICEKREGNWKQCIYYYTEALKHFMKALDVGTEMTQAWKLSLNETLEKCLKEAMEAIQNGEIKILDKVKALEELVRVMGTHSLSAKCYMNIATLLFKKSVTELQDKDYKKCLKFLHECNFPLEEAIRLSRNSDTCLQSEDSCLQPEETKSLKEDLLLHFCIAESVQARSIGDSLLHDVLEEEEDLNFDMIFEIIDWYKQAILLTREKEVEQEAIALSRLGKVCYKVLKQTDKGNVYLSRSIQLAASLHPKYFGNDEWFKEASKYLEEIQTARLVKDDAEKQKEKEKYLANYTDDLKKLEELKTQDAVDLVGGLYSSWPPKNKEHKFKKPSDDKWTPELKKKALMKAIHHYHPDRQSEEEHGKAWKYFCDEIVKCLNMKYECFKPV